MFQFTRPQGARLRRMGSDYVLGRFNSRARKGRDIIGIAILPPTCVSIHAPARGATSRWTRGRYRGTFQFTRPQGARHDCSNLVVKAAGFNSRARKGRDLLHSPPRSPRLFQFTRPQGARQSVEPPVPLLAGFNSRARKGRDCAYVSCAMAAGRFNSRARKGRDASAPHVFPLHRGFNSRARKGRDEDGAWKMRAVTVSIHAPARGATRAVRRQPWNAQVSIHAPARGATATRRPPCSTSRGFNSRARKGRDESRLYHGLGREVSIHAPARGATYAIMSHKPTRGGFNSRARKGRDSMPVKALSPSIVSIHAPARGATREVMYRWRRLVFQFTRPQGARPMMTSTRLRPRVSIHAPARGATEWNGSARTPNCFNSRARKGRDSHLRTPAVYYLCFNSRARKGRDGVS